MNSKAFIAFGLIIASCKAQGDPPGDLPDDLISGRISPTLLPFPCIPPCRPDQVCRETECVCRLGFEVGGICIFPTIWPPTIFPPTIFPPTIFPPTIFPPTIFPPTIFPPPCIIPCAIDRVCINGECVCREGNDHLGRCVVCPPPKIFQSCPTNCPKTCEDNPNEPTPCTLECDLSKYCVCPTGYVETSKNDDTCIREEECPQSCPAPKIFNGCPTSCPKTCQNPLPQFCVALCRPGVFCECPVGLYERSNVDSTCVHSRTCGFLDCSVVTCGENSYCLSGECVCNSGYVENEFGLCIISQGNCPIAPCPLNSYCFLGQCRCNEGYVWQNGQCVLDQGNCPFAPCPPHSYCSNGQCICEEGYVMDNGRCIDKCAVLFIFCGELKMCKLGECVCIDGYDMVEDVCVDSCRRMFCGPNTGCQHGECYCLDGYVEDDSGRCVAQGSCPFAPCPPNSQCFQGRCRCDPPYQWIGEDCVFVGGNTCPWRPCQPNSFCVDGECICDEGYVYQNGVCTANDGCRYIICPIGRTCVNGGCVVRMYKALHNKCTTIYCSRTSNNRECGYKFPSRKTRKLCRVCWQKFFCTSGSGNSIIVQKG